MQLIICEARREIILINQICGSYFSSVTLLQAWDERFEPLPRSYRPSRRSGGLQPPKFGCFSCFCFLTPPESVETGSFETHLPEDGVYCVPQEAFSGFRRQELRTENRHELLKIHLPVPWNRINKSIKKIKRETKVIIPQMSTQSQTRQTFLFWTKLKTNKSLFFSVFIESQTLNLFS